MVLVEIITRAGLVNEAFLPPFSHSIVVAGQLLFDPRFQVDILATLGAWGLGLLWALLVAIPAGILLGSWPPAYRATKALIDFVRPIPSVALIPLAILLLGTSIQMKSVLVLYAAIWPILFNAIYAVHDVDPLAKQTARSFGFGRLGISAFVVLPSSLPLIAAGIRVSAFIGLMMVISTELVVGGDAGIGSYMTRVQASGQDTIYVYAATIIAGVIGFIINIGLATLERRLFRWQPQERSE